MSRLSLNAEARSFEELTLGRGPRLEELVDRQSLKNLADSFFDLFRIPIKILSDESGFLAGHAGEPELYQYLSQFPQGRARLAESNEALRALQPALSDCAEYECFTELCYVVAGITHEDRRVGRIVIGPYLPANVQKISASLAAVSGPDAERLKEVLAKVPRAQRKTVGQIARHLQGTLEVILFSGHRALLTSSMHLASVRESYRELSEKNKGLQDALQRLTELDRLKTNFLATVSHELRTPLTSIIGYSEMMLGGIGGDLTPEHADYSRTIYEKGNQLLQLISGLLDLSKLESGTLSIARVSLDLDPVLRDVVQTLIPLARSRSVELSYEPCAKLPKVHGDATRLRQVFLNLTENALKFTPAGGRVLLTAEPAVLDSSADVDEGLVLLGARRGAVLVRVEDTGIGIPDAEKPKVFDAFYQVDGGSTREVGGTGLGLSIVRRLVESHSGTVRIEDNKPRGAIFCVTIPEQGSTVNR